jgi:hypothetical protein
LWDGILFSVEQSTYINKNHKKKINKKIKNIKGIRNKKQNVKHIPNRQQRRRGYLAQ